MPRHNPISEARDALIAAVARVNVASAGFKADAYTCECTRIDLEALAAAYDGLVDAILRDLAGALPGCTGDPFKDECYGSAALAMSQFIGPALSITCIDAIDEARWNYSAAEDAAEFARDERLAMS